MALSKEQKRNQAKKNQEAEKAKKKAIRDAKQKAMEAPVRGKGKGAKPLVQKKKK